MGFYWSYWPTSSFYEIFHLQNAFFSLVSSPDPSPEKQEESDVNIGWDLGLGVVGGVRDRKGGRVWGDMECGRKGVGR